MPRNGLQSDFYFNRVQMIPLQEYEFLTSHPPQNTLYTGAFLGVRVSPVDGTTWLYVAMHNGGDIGINAVDIIDVSPLIYPGDNTRAVCSACGEWTHRTSPECRTGAHPSQLEGSW